MDTWDSLNVRTPRSETTEVTSAAKKSLFSPFSPLNSELDLPTQTSEIKTPKRRLSLNLDESTQSPFALQDMDEGLGESQNSCSQSPLAVKPLPRSPLGELSTNSVQDNRRLVLAKRTKKRPTSLITEQTSLKENISDVNFKNLQFSNVSATTTRPSSFPSFSHAQLTESWPSAQGKSLIKQISSPLERMTLMSPSGSPVFFSQSTTKSLGSVNSHPLKSSSTTSWLESDGYFSELEVFESDDVSDTTSDTIKSLINAPLCHKSTSPAVFSSSTEKGLPCPTPIRPLPLQRTNSTNCFVRNNTEKNSTRSSLKRGSPSSAYCPDAKRPPLPFYHCSNSQDSPIANSNSPSTSGTRPHLKGRCLLRSQSVCTPAPAVSNVATDHCSPGEYIGDHSKPHVLPLVKGGSPELKCISPETLSKLISGDFSDKVDSYSIIDCRYPYEYEGGHIRGATNIYEEEDLVKKFFTDPVHPSGDKRIIYIFHCEFSSKRGPKMCRLLREMDRRKNGMEYFPKLYYPELYLLEGGYKTFYQTCSELCEPKGYCLMLDEQHKEDFRRFKLRAKSWTTSDPILQTRRQVPGQCRRRATVTFQSRPKSNSLDSKFINSQD